MATSMGGGPPGTPPPMRARASAAPGFDFAHWARTRGGFVALFLILLLSGSFVYVLWTLRDLPDPGKQDVLANTVIVYDRSGQVIEQRNAQGQLHDALSLRDMGRYGPAATPA